MCPYLFLQIPTIVHSHKVEHLQCFKNNLFSRRKYDGVFIHLNNITATNHRPYLYKRLERVAPSTTPVKHIAYSQKVHEQQFGNEYHSERDF
jgi:uncharacterized protein VirK/YbjX